jgi:hypothetical protein
MERNFNEVKQELKKLFFGIDEQIDQVVNAFETWLSVKEFQVRPITICLWGLTGTGKTALLNKAIDLLELNKKKFYIKFGSKTSGLEYDFEQNSCSDTIFILDEFQYFKSKKEDGSEIERDEDNSTNVIWELLDGGIVNLYGKSTSFSYEKMQIFSSIYILKNLDAANAALKDGIIYHPELYKHLNKMHIPPEKISVIEEYKNIVTDNEPYNEPYLNDHNNEEVKNDTSNTEILLKSLMEVNWHNLYSYVENCDMMYSFNNKFEFFAFLRSKNNISDLIDFFQQLREAKPKLEARDYSKSLIFVIGNLDECFKMSKDLNSDLDADYFYKETKKITITDVRKSLLKRFRSEQIARLGSSHIIYPSLNKKAFQEIINKELNTFKNVVLQKFPNVISNVLFKNNIKELIYKEGVFPVIGARSIFSTVNDIISDKFTYIVKLVLSMKGTNNLILVFGYNNKTSKIELFTYNKDNVLVNKEFFKYDKKVDQLRFEKNKGKQACISVHEAGHAVCSIILEHIFPETIYSVVLDSKNSGMNGFNLLNEEDISYYRKNTYINHIATLLGGYVAETIIFGNENITTGSSSDISNATSVLSLLYKNCGFIDDRVGVYISKNFTSTVFSDANSSIIDDDNIIQDTIKKNMIIAIDIAKKTIEDQRPLFLSISDYLAKHPKITNKKIKNLTNKYIVGITMKELNYDNENFYSSMLNENIKNINRII